MRWGKSKKIITCYENVLFSVSLPDLYFFTFTSGQKLGMEIYLLLILPKGLYQITLVIMKLEIQTISKHVSLSIRGIEICQ